MTNNGRIIIMGMALSHGQHLEFGFEQDIPDSFCWIFAIICFKSQNVRRKLYKIES